MNDSASSTFPCTEYANICILKGDLMKHIRRNHPKSLYEKNEDVRTANEILSPEKLKIFIETIVVKLSVDQRYPSSICNRFLKFEIDNILELNNLVEPLIVSCNGVTQLLYLKL